MKKILKKVYMLLIMCMMISSYNIVFANDDYEDEYLKEYKSIIDTMGKSMSDAPKTGNMNLDYLYEMIPHHQGAIDMSKNLLNYGGNNSEVKKIAESIIKSQTDEIESMKNMIKKLESQNKVDKVKEADYLEEYEASFKDMMTGLNNLKPTGNVDKDFLEEMIIHHQGAMGMVEAILKYSDNDEIRQMAEKGMKEQMPQVEEMKKIIENIK